VAVEVVPQPPRRITARRTRPKRFRRFAQLLIVNLQPNGGSDLRSYRESPKCQPGRLPPK